MPTELLWTGAADLAMGVGVFVAFACLVGAVMHFDAWLEERKRDGSTG